MRRLLFVVAAVLVVAGAAPAAGQTAPIPQNVGIRIVDVPTGRADDPRARQYIVDHLAPGTTITRGVEVSNDTTTPQAVRLYPGAATIADGGMVFSDKEAVSDLTTWTTIDPPSVRPAAGAKVQAAVKIVVPPGASPGERYGVVWAELAPAVPPGGGVTAVNRVGVRIYLSIGPGGEPATDFAITAFEASRDTDGRPLLAATVRNTGGRAVDLSGELRLTNGPGGLSAGPFAAKLGTTLGLGQTEPVLVALDPAIPRGPWDAHIVLRSGTTERDATAHVTFPELAATSAGSVNVKPGPGGSGGPGALLLAIGGAALITAVPAGVILARRWRIRRPRRRAARSGE